MMGKVRNLKWTIVYVVFSLFILATAVGAQSNSTKEPVKKEEAPLTLITATPEEGFQLAVKLSRKGVTTTQKDKNVLFMLREVYSRDPNALIACSQVIAINFQTVAAANNYWRDAK
jgi:hypothetical protein|nr:hexameric tyrosine-coordinated heme protein [Desulfuromonas sp. CSMB_57]